MPLFIIFILIPMVEIAVFIAVGEHIGLGTTLLLAFLTAIIGGIIIRRQGMETVVSLRTQMERGGLPLKEIFDGFCLVAAGALLITPGFVTDTMGFLLLIPKIREGLRHILGKYFKPEIHAGSATYRNTRDPHIIEADYEDITPSENDNENGNKK